MFRALLFALFFSLISRPALADLEQAKAAFLRGLAKEKARDYLGAIPEYETSLAQYPGYIYADKQLGNCFYYTGDHAKSLQSYDAYLAVRPDDAPTRAFADRLRGELDRQDSGDFSGRGPRRRRAATQPHSPTDGSILSSSFYLGGSINWLASGGDDFKQFYNPSAFNNVSVSNFSLYEDVHLGYLFKNGIAVEAGFEYLARVATVAYSYSDSYGYSYPEEDAYVDTESVFYLEPMYRFPLSRVLALSLGGKIGMASDSLTDNTYYSGDLAKGSGTLIAPELRLQILAGGRVGFELGAEYRLDDISPVNGVYGTVTDYSGGTWHLNNGGLALRFGLNVYFSRLTR